MTETLRLLTLNISGPSVDRAEQLAEYMMLLDLDVLVLSETRVNPGTGYLLNQFREAGYTVVFPAPSSGRERGVAVVRRIGPPSSGQSATVDLPHRLVIDSLEDSLPLRLVAAYVPSKDASTEKVERKKRFLCQMINALRRASRSGSVILMGDLNVVGRCHVPRYGAFRSWEYDALDDIAGHGFVDVFAELHPGVQAHSWIGRTGNGYRYDYVFVTPDLVDAVRSCEYLHEPRERGLSDHAALLVTLSGAGLLGGHCSSQLVNDSAEAVSS